MFRGLLKLSPNRGDSAIVSVSDSQTGFREVKQVIGRPIRHQLSDE